MAQKKFYDELERLKQRLAARETYRTAVPTAGLPAALGAYLTQPYGPPAAPPAAPYFRARDLKIPTQPNANIYSGNAINQIINRAANVGAPSPLGGTAWDAIKAQMNAPKAKGELIDPWSTPDPVADALGIGVPRETLLGPKSVAAKSVAAKGPTKAQQKIIDDAAKNYQSNSMPVLIQPQGPMKGGATMQPSINWGDANDAADFFRADELRRKMPGLLGWGGE